MKIGLIDVDGHSSFPNFALMRSSAYFKKQGHIVEWAQQGVYYDEIWASKVFTFTPDVEWNKYKAGRILKGGTGYDIKGRLPKEIEESTDMDYSIYPDCNYSLQFFSRGCIRHCPFCLVRDKEGYICPVEPVQLNPKGEWIEILDNNFFANPNWRDAVEYIVAHKQKVKLHGVDVRIMNEEQAAALKRMKHYRQIHIAWDLPKLDLRPQLTAMTKYIPGSKICCYVLIGFNSTAEQDLFRCRTLKEMKITPFVQPFRDYENKRQRTWYETDFARWANNHFFFKSCDFYDFEPRKGFKCRAYFDHPELRELPFIKRIKPPIPLDQRKPCAQLSLFDESDFM